MAEIKGTDIVMLRTIVREKGKKIEEELLAKLSPKAKDAYLRSMTISWLPVDIHSDIYQTAAHVLYPNKGNSAFELGLEIARQTYTGLYKIFLSIPSLQFIIKRAASLWKTYYNVGKASVENITSSALDFVVTEFPNWPLVMRDATNAHIAYLAQTAGKKASTSPAMIRIMTNGFGISVGKILEAFSSRIYAHQLSRSLNRI